MNLRLALVQLTSNDNVEQNVESVINALNDIQSEVDLVCFPENTFYFRINKEDQMQAVDLTEAFWSKIQAWCEQKDAAVSIGGTPLAKNNKIYNSTIWVDKNGVQNPYDKIHLFDVDVKGQASLKESEYFAYGEKPSVIEFKSWKIGLSICYDLRFAELYNHYAKENVDMIMVPSAFLQKTGEAHWHSLLKARAIESQCYVFAAAQSGGHKSAVSDKVRSTYGHSLGLDPWGQVLADLGSDGHIKIIEITKEKISEVRQQIPMQGHRRLWT